MLTSGRHIGTVERGLVAITPAGHGWIYCARVLMPVEDMFWGARYGKSVDPFGHEWGINQQLKKQTDEETQAAAAEFFAKRK